jgi:dipeptidyl-peptidase 4
MIVVKRIALLVSLCLLPLLCDAQDRLKLVPAYERYHKLSKETEDVIKSGALSVTWKNEGKALEYQKDGKRYRYDIETRLKTELASDSAKSRTNSAIAPTRSQGERRRRPPGPGRGRQFTEALSPDGKFKAVYRDRNVWLVETESKREQPITSDGCETARVKNGSASWVYGEELAQSAAMWWSSNSQYLAFYRFDESQVPDYYLALNQTNIQDTLHTEPYTKTGGTNPVVDLFVYKLETQAMIKVDARSGKVFDNSVPGHYVYGISWTADGQLLFHRTDRLQKILELCAANPDTGMCRVIVHEEWPASWVENSPEMRFLKDGRRFIWASERTGWNNYYLYDTSGCCIRQLTGHQFEVNTIVFVDEDSGCLYYTARSGDNPMKLQLHRVGLDSSGDKRLTDPAFNHRVDLAPDGRHFIDIVQTHDLPPTTRLYDREGNLIDQLAASDITKFTKLHLKSVELFTFKAADDQTELFGMLHFPSNFQPHRKYPLLVSVYAGPATTGARETFTVPDVLTELGFLVASFDSRSANGRGKRFLDAIYQNLGKVEIDDQAAGVKALACRRYVDPKRVGIFGTSYGGTASLLCLLRYPDVFQAACSCSPVTDFRNYDTIYTERYLGLPQNSPSVYDAVSVLNYAEKLKGRLMLYYGTADDNVHPSNSLQLIRLLQHAGKSFELQVGPDAGHTSLNRDRMMEFFVENLK